MLDDKDDFFSKAEKFAEGDYHNQGKKDKLELMDLPEDDVPDVKKSKTDKLGGFEDNDGDGNELIDDAIVEDE